MLKLLHGTPIYAIILFMVNNEVKYDKHTTPVEAFKWPSEKWEHSPKVYCHASSIASRMGYAAS